MQEEIEQKSVTLMINGTKFSLRTLKSAALKLLAHRQNPSAPGVKHRGKQTVRQLVGQNQGVSNVELSGEDIKAFERVARKYGVDYAVKKVKGDAPRFLIFFKARDADALNAALSEYTSRKMHGKEHSKLREKLHAPIEQVVTHKKQQEQSR